MATAACHRMIEVKLGDIIDPGNYWVVKASSLPEIEGMERAIKKHLGPALEEYDLRKGIFVAVRRENGESWFRGRITDVTTAFRGQKLIDAFLLDHGVVLKDIKYPDGVCHLNSTFANAEPYAFQFSLKGLAPLMRSYNLESPRHSVFTTRAQRWTEVTRALTYVVVRTCSRSWIKVPESMDLRSGSLVLELNTAFSDYYEKYAKILKKGGFTPQVPVFNLNQALISSKLAVCIESDPVAAVSTRLLPKFTVGYHLPRQSNSGSRDTLSSKDTLEQTINLECDMRRLRIRHELESLID